MIRSMESTTKADVTVYVPMFPGDEYVVVPTNFVILSKRLVGSPFVDSVSF